jgi:hypothetical protein
MEKKDKNGKTLKVGDKVKFNGKRYTINEFSAKDNQVYLGNKFENSHLEPAKILEFVADGLEDFLKGINFKQLKKQKTSLLQLIEQEHAPEFNKDLTGILHLIDAIQDAAVDEYCYSEKEVFKLSKQK